MGWDSLPPDQDLAKASGWDATPPDKDIVDGAQWSDLPNNIIPNAKEIGTNALETGLRTAKGIYDFPEDAVKSGAQIMSGGSPLDTPLAQDVKTVGGGAIDAVKNIPESLANLGSKDEWVNHPVQNAMTAGSIIYPAADAVMAPEAGGLSGLIGKGMANKGANMAAELGEVSGDTVKKINPRILGEEAQGNIRTAGGKPNVSDVRTQIGNKLVKDDVVGGWAQDVGDRIQKVNELRDSFGKQVSSALDDIRKANKSTGEYENVDDPLHIQATPILKDVLDVTNDLKGSARSGLRQTARYWRETYDSLAKKAEANNGRLTLDDIHSEMQDVGKDMKSGTNSPRYSTAKDIYGHLAEVRDNMVDQIAETLGSPELKSNLINANRGYSFYSKIADGLQDAGAGGEIPEKMGRHIVRSTMRGDPLHATGYLGLMKGINAIEPAMAEKLTTMGPAVEKYGGMAENAAKQGTRNVALTNFLTQKYGNQKELKK